MSIKSKIESLVPGGPKEVERAGQPVVITIARDFGSEGHEIGKMLSNELGIPFYDNEILVRSSLRTGEPVDKMAAYDEQLASEFMAFMPDRVDARTVADRLFEKMSEVIVDLGATETCIIEGRLSDYLLRCNPNQIAVLVTAPLADRIEIVRSKLGITRRRAAQLVKRMQKARERFYRRYSAGRWQMRKNKDLVVNRSKLGRQGCVDVIAAAYRAKLSGLGIMEEAAAEALEDEQAKHAMGHSEGEVESHKEDRAASAPSCHDEGQGTNQTDNS